MLFGSVIQIEKLKAPFSVRDRADLVALLTACVEAGASIGFLAPLANHEAKSYWDRIEADTQRSGRIILAARETASGGIIGTAQLALESRPNGRHRAEVQKVMVLPTARRRGVATDLIRLLEAAASARGVTLLFLDTSDSHAGARPLYEALRYVYVGGIPGYALDPHGIPEPNAIYYKTLAPAG